MLTQKSRPCNLDGMAKQKKPQGEKASGEQPVKATRSGEPLHVWIPSKLRKAIKDASKKNRRPLTTEVIIALEHYLASIGLWEPEEAKE